MKINTAEFITSAVGLDDCPRPAKAEFAFLGRSNVGKSSLINMLVNRKDLAKTSGKPGKTRTINYFLINGSWFLVDLPGVGYAKTSKKDREKWRQMIEFFLYNRATLLNTFYLIDARIPPQKTDLEVIDFFGYNQLPFTLLFTKTDKLKPAQLKKNVEHYKTVLSEQWEELPGMIQTSAFTGLGRDEILKTIEDINQMFREDFR
ncbi:MAG: ribosome biogenesis GTP-binding protein YihA/YsxC [Bacteroidales bacterium]|nr:ribosome biogenesis GTP-binding protein YihA/YsxC [Bacteroidales bacterium]